MPYNYNYSKLQLLYSYSSLFVSVVAIVKNEIIVCSEYNCCCWKYVIATNSWVKTKTGHGNIGSQPGAAYKNKLYTFINDGSWGINASDPYVEYWGNLVASNSFSRSCSVVWKDVLVVIGGNTGPTNIQSYNFTGENWEVLPSVNVTFDWPGCAVIPMQSNTILIAGSSVNPRVASVFDMMGKQWELTENMTYGHFKTDLIALGSRVFVLGGSQVDGTEQQTVEEYNYLSRTWSVVKVGLLGPRTFSRSISLPDNLFNGIVGSCTGIY